ncbi:HAD family hydrolase [Jatrophihabitans endophyticus]|uniref:HAD family hydrolase n=1 Tax=Jatrophihabitans endophyticus TaxID=1206085 RepID=UPI0026EFCBB5|nr:HAD family hydrolase [Jatrophihabitans endophyticus]
MSVLCASDLDRTLVYSPAAISRWGPAGPTVAVERYRDADASFVTVTAARHLEALGGALVPVTTRTVAQAARIRLPGPAPRWSVAANGGVLLEDGVPDPSWAARVHERLRDVAGLPQVADHVRAVCRPEWTSAVRVAEDLFVYAVVDPERLPAGFVAEQRADASGCGWTLSLQGRKLYWVPAPLTKSAAVAEIARRHDVGRVIAAGDSLLDLDLLAAADEGLLARHGELATAGWTAPHVVRTQASGIAAGEEIAAWFVRRLAESPANDQVTLITRALGSQPTRRPSARPDEGDPPT